MSGGTDESEVDGVVSPRASAEPVGATPPGWFAEEIRALTAGSGRWIADNSRYKTEQEPFDAYGIVWTASFDGTTATGRLFGLHDGKETADFWEFRQYWEPQRKQVVLEQFGWGGSVGIGTCWRDGEMTKSDQTFHKPGAAPSRTGHRSSFPDADTHVTGSFDIEDDVWKPRRSYTWKRVALED